MVLDHFLRLAPLLQEAENMDGGFSLISLLSQSHLPDFSPKAPSTVYVSLIPACKLFTLNRRVALAPLTM